MSSLTVSEVTALATLVEAPLLRALQQSVPFDSVIRAVYDQLVAALAARVPFVPVPVLEPLLADPEHGRMIGVYLNGTVVCAALSGFGALASQLERSQRRGSETLSNITRRLFTALSDEVLGRGGGIVKFGGNGLTAFFDSRRLGEGHSALAAAAALGMQAQMQEFAAIATDNGVFSLQLRVGVQGGRIFAADVGDATHRELIIAGRVVSRTIVAQDSAMPGGIVVVGETRGALPGAQLRSMNDDFSILDGQAPVAPPPAWPPWQPGPPNLASIKMLLARIVALQPYLPHGLAAGTIGNEFRPVTVLFQDFYALSRLLTFLELPALSEQDPTIVGKVANLFYIKTQQVLHQFGGNINKVDTATFGNRCLAMFGAPTTHEDDPERAVRAALALKAALPDTGRAVAALLRQWGAAHPEQLLLLRTLNTTLHQRTGIASGPLFVGVIGTAQRREYTVMGATVGLAARLMTAAANNTILVSSIVRHAIRREIATLPKPNIIVNETGPRVPVFEVSEARANVANVADTLHRSVALVGREAELKQILSVGQAALEVGGVVALVGEPGIGKTRLMDEALRIIQTQNETVTLVTAACESYEQTTPYAVITHLARQMLALMPQHSDKREQAAAVQHQLDATVPQWSRFAPLLAPLLALPIPETELTSALSAEQRRDRLHDLIVMTCCALAQRAPLVLVVDDLQWADASSRMLIERMAEEATGQPLLLALVYRSSHAGGEPWRALAYTTVVELHELPRPKSEELLRALLDGVPPAELAPLIERAHGTPFFLEETVGYLLRSGTLRRAQDGTWVCAVPVDRSVIPAQIDQLLVARLDQLPADARAITQTAAVVGQRFSVRLLDAVQGTNSATLTRILLDVGILVPDEATEVEPGYEFRHALLRDVAYETLPFARRRELHARVAEAIEQVHADDLDTQRVTLAQHYSRAEQHNRAFSHFGRAAQEAQARYANREAITLYRAAISSAPWRNQGNNVNDLSAAIPLYESLGDILALTGDYTQARDTYEWLLGLLQTHGGTEYTLHIAALQRKLGSAFEQQGNLEAALHWFDAAGATIERAASSENATLEQARIESDTGWVHFRRNNLDEAQQCLEEALSLVADNHPDEQARILNRLGGVAWTRGEMERAQEYVERSLAASERSGDLVSQAWALNNLALLTQWQGHEQRSVVYSLRAIDISNIVGNSRMSAIVLNNIGWTFYYCEEYHKSYTFVSRAFDVALYIRDTYMQMITSYNLGRVLTEMKELNKAEYALRQSQFIAIQLNLPAEQLDRHVAIAELSIVKEDLKLALEAYQQCFSLNVDTDSEEYGRFQRLEAKLAHAQGDTVRGIELLQANEELFTRLHNVPETRRTRKLLDEIMTQAAGDKRNQ